MIGEDGTVGLKNPKVDELMLQHFDDVEDEYFNNDSLSSVGEYIISGFWCDFMKINVNLPIDQRVDFSYETLRRMPSILTQILAALNESDTAEDIMFTVATYLGAYMFGVAMNEHNAEFYVEIKSHKEAEKTDEYYWNGGVDIRVGVKKKINFLKPAIESVNVNKLGSDVMLLVNMTPIVNAYKDAFDIDLSEHDFKKTMMIVNRRED